MNCNMFQNVQVLLFFIIFLLYYTFFSSLLLILQRSRVFGVSVVSLCISAHFSFNTAGSLQDVAAATVVAMLPTF